MFIQTEATPNPATLKFVPGIEVMPMGRSLHLTEAEQAAVSPLATRLFEVDGVAAVYLAEDFIAVTQNGAEDWAALRPTVLAAIMDHFTSGLPVVEGDDDGAAESNEEFDEADADIVGQIKELLETRVRPAVAQDGGDIVFQGFKEGTVYLHMQGACAGCPSSTMTLKMGIENLLRHYVPEVNAVEAVA